jgi:hypothetical protein
MLKIKTNGENGKALSLKRQWAAAEADFRHCLTAMHNASGNPGQESRTGKNAAKKGHLRSKAAQGKPVDLLLGLLLRAMHAKFAVDAQYRKNIKNFTAQYVYKDRAAKICQVAHFANGKMRVSEKVPENPTFTLVFRDGKALLALLFSPAPDVLNALLNQEVDFTGNINYLNKFAYMALLAKPHF